MLKISLASSVGHLKEILHPGQHNGLYSREIRYRCKTTSYQMEGRIKSSRSGFRCASCIHFRRGSGSVQPNTDDNRGALRGASG